MPDDDRTRRRLGDDTKGRIADLASGWSVDTKEPAAAPEPPPPTNAARQRTKTMPPPPPGSAERKALEAAIVEANTPIPIAAPRTKPPTAPPRPGTKTGTNAVVGPQGMALKSGPTETGTVARVGVIGATGPVPIADRSGSIVHSAPVKTAASAANSGAIPIGDRSGAIVNSAPINKAGPPKPMSSGLVPRPMSGSGSMPAIPAIARTGNTGSNAIPKGSPSGSIPAIPSGTGPTRSAPRTAPPPIPSAKVALPLPARGDPTDVSAASPNPPPVPPPRRAVLVSDLEVRPDTDEQLTVPEDQPGAMPRLAVPVGEFDTGQATTAEPEKLRIAYEQSTLKRDASNALLGIAEASETQVKSPPVEMLLEETAQHLLRGDPTNLDSPPTTKFERGDPTLGPDPTIATVSPGHTAGGTLRSGATLRRKRGFGGDMRYVVTVLMGVRRARGELEALEKRQELRQQSRRRHLITLGRAAASLDNFDHPALGPARELLAGVEDERSKHVGAVTAADSELARVHRDRDTKAKQIAEEMAALEVELADITKKLEPLDKESAAITRRASDLRDSLRRIDAQIAATEASQHSVKKGKEVSEIHAEIATLRADRMSVKRDEPQLAAELDALNPRIAALESRRSEARKRRGELEQAEIQDRGRVEELLAAIGAKRKVVDRAAGDAEAVRDTILFELGERLYVDRSADVSAQLAPIDVLDVELGTGERRAMELREILSSVDKAKLARGIAFVVMILTAIGAITAFILYLALVAD